ncbi:hypothetical protein [Algihabitans albus]|uniref:hypothetical protein n=1 Tax=Algihabitans albus TaxID=2164067 RepID=UPI000E5CED54|nr:hypothetical protein [Algihabitans albus]
MSDFALRHSTNVEAGLPGHGSRSGQVRNRRRNAGSYEFWLYFAVSFPIFLTIAVLARLLPRSWRPGLTELRGKGSVFGEAKAAANRVLPFVFMT